MKEQKVHNKTQQEIIRELCYNKGVDSSLIEEFIAVRFPQEMHTPYISEWIERFKSGNPLGYMDKKSKMAFKRIVDKRCKGV